MFYSSLATHQMMMTVQTIFACSCCIIVTEVKVPLDKFKSVPRHCLLKYWSLKNSSH